MNKVKMKVNPRIIEHLGSDLITSAAVAVVELIKNSIDAHSKRVNIQFFDGIGQIEKNDKMLVPLDDDMFFLLKEKVAGSNILLIEDIGIGMNAVQLQEGYLNIGTDIKYKDYKNTNLGEKGIGRLAAQCLGKKLILETASSDDKRTILLSSLFERMSNNVSSKEIENNDFEAFQRFEQYDYHVNEFMTPPMTGDIFYIKGNYYLLLGQECDLSIRNGRRKNPIAELVPIKLVKNRDMGNFKEKYNYEKLLLGKFLDADGKCCNISIDCTKREVIDNEIIDLCAFNDFGKSEICLNQELKIEAKYLLPIEWQQYYENLKIHLLNLKNKYDLIKEHEEILGFNVVQLVNDMGASHNNRLVSIIDFSIEDNVIKYDVKRICRIRNHVLLINKMFLEYRGRQAFNTINMDIGRNTSYAIEIMGSDERVAGNDVTVILTTSRKENENIKRRDWIINKEDILRTIKNVKPLESEKYEKVFEEMDNSILLESNTGNIKNAIKYTKLSTNDELILKLQLLK